MAKAKFISVDYVKLNTIIDSSVDANLLETNISVAQDKYIEGHLGYTLYQRLMNDVINDTLSGYYLTLMTDYIQPCLNFWTLYEAYPNLNYKVTNKAVSTKHTDTTDASSLEELQYLRQGVRSTAEHYGKKIREYIINNIAQFPEYYQIIGFERTKPSSKYFGGIWLEGRKHFGGI